MIVQSALVGWCRECEGFIEPYIAGNICLFDCETLKGFPRKLVKRRMFFCPVTGSLERGFFSRAEARDCENHACWL